MATPKYVPMDKKLKEDIAARFEAKHPRAFIIPTERREAAKVQVIDVELVIKAEAIIVPVVEEVLALKEEPIEPRTMRVVYLSDAWTQLVTQGWVTTSTEEIAGTKFGIMKQY